ncbi:MAG: c-type cytochrome [Noviherbaspirillum sp.]
MNRIRIASLPVILYLLLLAGCERAMQDMYDQSKYKPMSESKLFADGGSARTPPPGTLPYAKGGLAATSSGRAGRDAVEQDARAMHAQANPYPVTSQLLARGQERYTIYCQPCHSPAGDGDGWIARRGFPHPPSYHIERLRAASDRHFFDVITNGYGIMYSYADRVEPPDRWAIVAYIRALQLSQHADARALPEAVRAQLPPAGRRQ